MKRWCVPIFVFLVFLFASPAYADKWFVSKSGSDANSGKSWANAFLTEARIDGHGSGDSAGVGDTVVFGTGFWYDVYVVTLSDSWYVCSSYYDYMTGAATFQQAVDSSRLSTGRWRTVLYSGKELTGITKVGLDGGGNDSIWKASWTATEGMINSWPTTARIVSQGGQPDYAESLLCRQTSLANLDQPGEWYIATAPNPDTIYFIPYGDVTGTSVNMIASCNAVFHFEPPGSDINQIHIWGLECKGGQQGTILVEPNGGDVESCYVEYCHLAFSAQNDNENASVVMFRRETPFRTRFFRLRHDSIGWAFSDPTDNSGTPPWQGNSTTSDGSKSAGIRTYNSENLYVDSCTLYGFYSCGIHLKNDPYGESHTVPFFGNNIRFSHIFNTGGIGVYIGEYPYRDSIYGNVIEGMARAIFEWESSGAADIDSLWDKFAIFVGNNAFYNITENIINFAYSGGEPCGDSNKYVGNIAYNCNLSSQYFRLCDEGSSCSQTGVTDTWRTVNYNMWFGGSTFSACIDGSSRNWTYWTGTRGWDVNGTSTTNPNFSSPTGSGDMWTRFSRPSAGSEMSLTYGGVTWTKSGPVQSGATDTCPTVTRDLPTNGSITTDLTPNYQFDISDLNNDSVYYRLYQDSVSPPTTLRFSGTVATPANNITLTERALNDLKTYYWRIVYADTIDQSGGDANASCVETTSIFTYFTDTMKCPTVTQTAPANGATVVATSTNLVANFDVEGSAGNIIIRLFGEPSDVTPDVLLITDTLTADSTGWTYNWTGLTNGLTYYWQIIATDPDCADTSSIFNFAVVLSGNPAPIRMDGVIINGTRIGKTDEDDGTQAQRHGPRWVDNRHSLHRWHYPGFSGMLADAR